MSEDLYVVVCAAEFPPGSVGECDLGPLIMHVEAIAVAFSWQLYPAKATPAGFDV
ncbi:hypothetical protein ACFYUK_33270 [Nonomuraea wenchangensis]